jgi:asparagine synthase (glutamine-hydrolysing)
VRLTEDSLSRLIGIWHFDSRPVHARDVAWVLEGLGACSHEHEAVRRGPGLVMGPFCAVSLEGSICSWDGRLDNRQDLLPQSGHAGSLDSTLALNLYETRGPDGLGKLVGDWSLVIAEPARSLVVLASDYAGIRPLYYCRTADSLRWSSSLSHLVRWTGNTELDDEYVAAFLTRGSAAHRTPYRGIYPVPPGRAVCVSPRNVSTHLFWDLPVERETKLKNSAEYEEQLRELFAEAVAVRLPLKGQACAELSGGLDSSSVVCMADRVGPEKPVTFTYTYTGSTDEKYVRVVERARGLTSVRLDLDEFPFIAANQAGMAAPAWWGPRFDELARRLASIEAGVFLTGQLGDFVMGNTVDDSGQAADYVRNGRWVGAAREAYAWSRSLGIPIYPVLWKAFRAAYSQWSPPMESHGYRMEHSLASGLLTKVCLKSDDGPAEHRWREASPGRRSRFRALSAILDSRSLQVPEALQHISYTHPFAHRPLVEFMLTIPSGEVCRPGGPRNLMRRSFGSLLPPPILQRRSKASYGGAYRDALLPLATGMLQRPSQVQLLSRGYVDRGSLIERLSRFVYGLECNEPQLRQLLLFEFWLRHEGHPRCLGTTTSTTVPLPTAESSLNTAPMVAARSLIPLMPQ